MQRRTVAALLLFIAAAAGCGQTPRAAAPAAAPAAVTDEDRALAEAAAAVLTSAAGTPGQEHANRLRDPERAALLKMLRGERPATEAEMARARREVAGIVRTASQGPGWPRPALIGIPRASTPIQADGVLDEPAWQRAATFTGMYLFNDPARVDSPRTVWRMLWDDRFLYFAFECEDRDLVSPHKPRDGTVYFDDCVEMFILSEFRFRTYWEIDIGLSGDLYDSVQCKDPVRWGASQDSAENVKDLAVGIRLRGTLNKQDDTDEGYTVEVAVPFSELPGFSRCGPKAGDRLYLMLARLDRDGKVFKAYAFQPLLSWGHNIWNHAPVELKAE